MRKSAACCLFALVLLCSWTFWEEGQTSDEILGKMIEAVGGRKALENIKDITIVAEVNMIQEGILAKAKNSIKEPNLTRLDIEVQGLNVSQIFDGEKVWMIDPLAGTGEQMPDEIQDYAKREALGFSCLLNPKEFGITYSCAGSGEIENKKYFIIVQEYDDGYRTTYYLDGETFLPFKYTGTAVDGMLLEVTEETYSTDYRRVEGVMVAHSISVYQDGQKYMTSTVSDVKFNTGLADSLFKKGN